MKESLSKYGKSSSLNRELPRGFLLSGICLTWRLGSGILKQNEGEIRDTENNHWLYGIEKKTVGDPLNNILQKI